MEGDKDWGSAADRRGRDNSNINTQAQGHGKYTMLRHRHYMHMKEGT